MNRSTQFKAMASESRLTILRMLAEPQENFGHQRSVDPIEFGECMTRIDGALGIAQNTISRHLDILRRPLPNDARTADVVIRKRNEAVIQSCLVWLRFQLLSPA
ncbi:helix-turn-helix domain-containing protein [Microvirga makkahensis]|uniref:Helix-turn-helix domain-containing protein n=2 Tax=Microvirga makkahensis TaxID=1128670 RepID=A0A7X3SMQ7_9HYPH|nr:helix-turn-helix domain-containing protein [Microvirga makkahensis]